MKNKMSIAGLIFVLFYFGFFMLPAAQAAILSVGGNLPYGGYECMDVRGGATEPGTPVQIWDCHGWSNQQWTMQGYTIFGIGSTGNAQNCLDVDHAGKSPGTTVNMNACNGKASQKWYYRNGQLHHVYSGLCLDAGSQANFTILIINHCSSTASQQWQIK